MNGSSDNEGGIERAPVHQSILRKPLFGGVEFEIIASLGLFALCFFLALRDFTSAIILSAVVLVPIHFAVAAMQRRDPALPWYVLRLATSKSSLAASPDLHAPAPPKTSSVR